MRKSARHLTPPPEAFACGVPETMDPLSAVQFAQNNSQYNRSDASNQFFPPNHGQKRRRVESVSTQCVTQEVHRFISEVMMSGPASLLGMAASDPASVEAALYQAIRTLRTCWSFSGNPRDSFESVNALSPMAIELLLSYGRHQLTPDHKFLVLSNGKEDLPWVGFLLVILREYLTQRLRHREESPAGYIPQRRPNEPSRKPDFHRVLLLNCHSFGWLDSIGNEDYEGSTRYLIGINNALREMVHDPNYASNRIANGTGKTLVLLSNAILMDGGLPSLGLTAHSQVFDCHHQYGRGLACLIPTMPSPSVAIDSRGLFSGNSSFHTETNQADASYNLSIEELKPISCGERTFSGVAVQAVLLSPSGPLVLQTQFERTTVSQFGAGQPPVSMDPFELPNLLEAYLTHEAHPFEGDASGLLELILWALRLLHSPQPTLFVEWHLQSPHHNPHHTPQAGNFGMSATPFSHSIFFRLLTVYQKFANCQSGAPVGHTSYTDASSVAGAVENTLREFVPCASTQFFDGKERPLVFVKDMEVTGETERYIGTDTVISSIRTHLN